MVDFVLNYVEYAIAALSLALNALLAMLIVYRTTKELRPYSRMLLLSCAAELILATTSVTLRLRIYYNNGVVFFIFDGLDPGAFAASFFLVLFNIWTFWFSASMTAALVGIRYLFICRDLRMASFCLLLVIVPAALVAALGPCLMLVHYYPEARRMFEAGVKLGSVRSSYPLLALYQKLSWSTLAPMLAAVVAMSIIYGVIIFCTNRTWACVLQTATSHRTMALQKQIHYALISQALVPIVIIMPIALMLVIMLFGDDKLASVLPYTTSVIACGPVMSPLCTIYCVSSYRNALRPSLNDFIDIIFRRRRATVTPAKSGA